MLEPNRGACHVLLVEDDAPLRRALARAIRLEGYRADEFGSAEELLAGILPDRACLVLDIALPGIGGIELKRRLMNAGNDRPTIFITAIDAAEIDPTLAPLGPLAILHKPFARDVLLGHIGRAFR